MFAYSDAMCLDGPDGDSGFTNPEGAEGVVAIAPKARATQKIIIITRKYKKLETLRSKRSRVIFVVYSLLLFGIMVVL